MSRRYLRPQALIGHVLVLAAALTCLRLGWWQWNVFEAVRGTGQNLGYALLWPVFAGSFIYMWLRFLQLEATRGVDGEDASAAATDSGDGRATQPDSGSAPDTPESSSVAGQRNGPGQRHTRPTPAANEALPVGIGYVGADDEEDPELAEYNRALARLAEEDQRRAR